MVLIIKPVPSKPFGNSAGTAASGGFIGLFSIIDFLVASLQGTELMHRTTWGEWRSEVLPLRRQAGHCSAKRPGSSLSWSSGWYGDQGRVYSTSCWEGRLRGDDCPMIHRLPRQGEVPSWEITPGWETQFSSPFRKIIEEPNRVQDSFTGDMGSMIAEKCVQTVVPRLLHTG